VSDFLSGGACLSRTHTMNEECLYVDNPELQTEEEKEDLVFVNDSYPSPDLPDGFREWWLGPEGWGGSSALAPSPEACERREFEERQPGMRMTLRLIDAIIAHDSRSDVLPVQRRRVYQIIRGHMLRNLIPCSDCSTIHELLAIIRAEIESNTCSPVPDWYPFSTKTFGPRRIGYYHCSAIGCFKTEDTATSFKVCAGCKLPKYCCKECQVSDWKRRHKFVCSKGKEQRDQVKRVSQMLQRFSDMSLTGQTTEGMSFPEIMAAADNNPAVQERRAFLKAEKKRKN